MYNPRYDMTNRLTRRRAMKLVAHDDKAKPDWQKMKYHFRPNSQPTMLGINKYKKQHGDEPKRVVYYKKEMWYAFHELKKEKQSEQRQEQERSRRAV